MKLKSTKALDKLLKILIERYQTQHLRKSFITCILVASMNLKSDHQDNNDNT